MQTRGWTRAGKLLTSRKSKTGKQVLPTTVRMQSTLEFGVQLERTLSRQDEQFYGNKFEGRRNRETSRRKK